MNASLYRIPCLCGRTVDSHAAETRCPHCGRLLVVEGREAESKQPTDSEALEWLCDYIHRYADSILVREQIAGRWGNVALSQLPTKIALEHALGFIKRGVLPVRVLSETELQAQKAGQR